MTARNDDSPSGAEAIEQAAAEWLARMDRGLSAHEQDEYSRWLAADPRHRAAIAEHRWGWEELDRLAGLQEGVPAPPNAQLFSEVSEKTLRRPARRRVGKLVLIPLLGGIAAGMLFFLAPPREVSTAVEVKPALSTALAAPCDHQVLEDGSVVELNRGARITVEFTRDVRRVKLERGEANFTVAKDVARPFSVDAGGVVVRALGTVFNVRLVTSQIDVIVTEGKVEITRRDDQDSSAPLVPVLRAQQQAMIPNSRTALPAVKELSTSELQARLAWQPRLLDFSATPLPEIVAEFNRRNPVRLVVGSPELRDLRLNASIRSDNVEGFLRLMESDFGMRAEWASETEIVLRKAD
jgi:transmembrane sensor